MRPITMPGTGPAILSGAGLVTEFGAGPVTEPGAGLETELRVEPAMEPGMSRQQSQERSRQEHKNHKYP